MTTNSVTLKLTYNGTEFTRSVKLTDVSMEALTDVKDKIIAINASLASGTDDGMAQFFVSDDNDLSQNIGTLKKITNATIECVEETPIAL